MKFKILGCSGGIGGKRRTTSFILDDSVLIDCGTGVGDLTFSAMLKISDVFLTHSHQDHICMLPMLADAIGENLDRTLKVHALPQTVDFIKTHIFNNRVWPDYTKLPRVEAPWVRFIPLEVGETILLHDGAKITALAARHSVPAIGYLLDSGNTCLAFSGDTTYCKAFWQTLGACENLSHIIIENTFLCANVEGARRSGHMTAQLLVRGLEQLKKKPFIHISHLDANFESAIMREIKVFAKIWHPVQLHNGDVIDF